jgi:PAS domain S-box-containing protein
MTESASANPPVVPADRFDPDDFGIGQLFWAIRDAVIVGDVATGRIVLWNPAAETLFGYAADEALGMPIDALIPKELRDRHRHGFARYAATGTGPYIDTGLPIDLPALHRDGRPLAIELGLTPVAHSRVVGNFVLAVIRDVSARKRADSEHLALVHEQAARELAERAIHDRDLLLSSISHDLRTPLAGIKLTVDLLRRRLRRAEPNREQVLNGIDQIEASADRMTALIADLLDAAQLGGGLAALRREPVDLVTLAKSAIAARADGPVRLEAAAPEAIISADRVKLERVLANLLDNAIKYSPNGGEATVRVTLSPEWAEIAVRDRGIGVPAADLPRLFEPFFRAANARDRLPGTGIGLAGARRIAEQHGGAILVESVEGEGSVFTLRLPRSA